MLYFVSLKQRMNRPAQDDVIAVRFDVHKAQLPAKMALQSGSYLRLYRFGYLGLHGRK